MRVLVYTDEATQGWADLLAARGHESAILAPGTPPPPDAEVCLIVMADPLAARFWMADLALPLLLITSALTPARALCGRLAWLRIICHASRALHALDDMLLMTRDIQSGTALFGPPAQSGRGVGAVGGRHAIN
jgi:hypothetical protein